MQYSAKSGQQEEFSAQSSVHWHTSGFEYSSELGVVSANPFTHRF